MFINIKNIFLHALQTLGAKSLNLIVKKQRPFPMEMASKCRLWRKGREKKRKNKVKKRNRGEEISGTSPCL